MHVVQPYAPVRRLSPPKRAPVLQRADCGVQACRDVDHASADERVDHYYALTSPSPLRATRRAESYRAAVHEWRTTRHEEEAQRLLRAVATSVATVASGTWLAPGLAHFVIFGVAASRPGPDPGDT